jgi:iron complex outermembrane receptor protein
MQKLLLLVSLTSLCFTCSANANAADSEEEIPTVYVSATRSEQSAVSTPALISIIDRDAIESSGADHLVDVLQSQAGLQIEDLYGDGSRAKISMRGFGADNAASNVLVLVDGRRLNRTDLSAPDLNSISLKDVERIEIIQGSAGTLFGDQAVGGVINIITRKPDKSIAEMAVTYGSYDNRKLHTTIGTRTKNGSSIRASVEQRSTDNYREYNHQDYRNASIQTSFPIADGTIGFEYQALGEYLQLPGALTTAQLAADRRQANTTTDFNDSTTDIARGTYKRGLSRHWNLEAELSDQKGDINGALYGSSFDQHRRQLGFTPRLVGSIPVNNGDVLITTGADVYQSRYRFILPAFSIDTNATQLMRAVYAQGIIPLGEKLNLTVGARHVQNEDDITDATAFPSGVDIKKSATVFELGLARQINENLRVFARRDENLRFAKVDENTFTDPAVTGLKPQTGVSYELGTQWHRGGKRFNFMAYQIDLNNEIAYDETADGPYGPGTGANVNLDPTRRLGFNIGGRIPFNPRFALDMQYAYVDAIFRGGPYSGNAIPFVARHNITVRANWRLPRHWRLFLESRYTSDRYQGSDYNNSRVTLPAVAIVNTGLRYVRDGWSLDLRINNVGDVEYSGYATYDTYYPAPTRNFTVKARVELH